MQRPKSQNVSKKIAVAITRDEQIISQKANNQPLSENEMIALNRLHNEALIRIKFTVNSLNTIMIYLEKNFQGDRNEMLNLKQFFIEKKAPDYIQTTLKMIKRHFYININHLSIGAFLKHLKKIETVLWRMCCGLNGELDIKLKILNAEPMLDEVAAFEPKTYVIYIHNQQWKLSYYENNVKIKDIALEELNINISRNMTSAYHVSQHEFFILNMLMTYHAKNLTTVRNKVYIRNISRKKQNDKENRKVGYVYRDNQGYYGPIYIDYRLLLKNPMQALQTLIHEGAHRYGFVSDEGYYHQIKTKNGKQRLFPESIAGSLGQAMNNADTYAFFVIDSTAVQGKTQSYFLTTKLLPAWSAQEEYQRLIRPLPHANKKVALLKSSFFVIGTVIAAVTAFTAVTVFVTSRCKR